jgi:hypothetical protein
MQGEETGGGVQCSAFTFNSRRALGAPPCPRCRSLRCCLRGRHPAAAAIALSGYRRRYPSTLGFQRDARISAALDDISPARLRAMDSTLVSFGTRHTMSDTVSSTRGVGAARRWITRSSRAPHATVATASRVEYDTGSAVITRHPIGPAWPIVNVVAWLAGARHQPRGGHRRALRFVHLLVNSRWTPPDAPGADDDGSGTVAVMELARVVGKRFPKGLDASIAFVLYTGEELGLLGSTSLRRAA